MLTMYSVRTCNPIVSVGIYFICNPPQSQHHRSKDNARPGGWMTHLGPDHPAFQLTFGADLLADNNCVESMSTLGKPVLPWTHNLDTSRRLQLSATSFPNHQCQDQTRSLKVPSCSWPAITSICFCSIQAKWPIP